MRGVLRLEADRPCCVNGLASLETCCSTELKAAVPAAPGDLEDADLLKGRVTPERVEPTELPGLENEVDGLSFTWCCPKDSTGAAEAIESAKFENDVVLGLESDTPNDRPVPSLLRRLSPTGSKAIRSALPGWATSSQSPRKGHGH